MGLCSMSNNNANGFQNIGSLQMGFQPTIKTRNYIITSMVFLFPSIF